MTGRYISEAEVASDENLDLTDGAVTDLTPWILAAEAEIDSHCRRTFSLGTAEARVFAARSARSVLRITDFATAPTLVEMRDGIGSAWRTVTDWEAEEPAESGWPWTALVRPCGWQPRDSRQRRVATVRVTAEWGWASVPADVKGATRILTVRLSQRFQDPIMVSGGLLGDPDVKRMLMPYIRPTLR